MHFINLYYSFCKKKRVKITYNFNKILNFYFIRATTSYY